MSSKGPKKSELQEQIELARSELRLKEAERAAFTRKAAARAKARKAEVAQLKQEIEVLKKQNAEEANRDANVIKEALRDKPELLRACSNMSAEKALAFLRRKKLLLRDQINALNHDIQVDQRRQEELKRKLKRAAAQNPKQQESLKKLSKLKEDVERVKSENKELQSDITKLQKAKDQLQKEALTFPAQREKAKAERLKDKRELEDLRSRVATALQFKEDTETEGKKMEKYYKVKLMEADSMIASKEEQIKQLKAQGEELRGAIERKNRQREEQRREAERRFKMEEEARLAYKEAFHIVQKATGITNIEDLKQHFLCLEETQQQLVDQKEENEKTLQQLEEEKELLVQQLEDMKEKAQA